MAAMATYMIAMAPTGIGIGVCNSLPVNVFMIILIMIPARIMNPIITNMMIEMILVHLRMAPR